MKFISKIFSIIISVFFFHMIIETCTGKILLYNYKYTYLFFYVAHMQTKFRPTCSHHKKKGLRGLDLG